MRPPLARRPHPDPLADLILRHAAWLEDRLLPGPADGLEQAGWLTTRGVAELVAYAPRVGFSPDRLEASQGVELALLAELSVEAARRRGLQGQRLGAFLLECKASRQAVLTLLDRSDLEPLVWADYTRTVERSFDLLEHLICRFWEEPGAGQLAARAPAVTASIQAYARDLVLDRNRYQSIFERLPNPVILLDGENRLDLWNAAAQQLVWVSQMDDSPGRRGQPAGSVFPWLSDALERQLASPDEEFVLDKIVVTPAGARDYQILTRPLLDPSGARGGAVVVLQDVTERRVAEEQVGFLGSHDHLTGLYNRAYFEDELERLARGRVFPISIVMLDVDDLQVTNDTLGFAAGNDLLRRVAGILRASFRAEDLVARIGGDEFAVLLRGVDGRTARAVCQRLSEGLQLDLQENPPLPLEVSLGIATALRGDQLSQALIQADEHMTRAKSAKPPRRVFGAFAARVM